MARLSAISRLRIAFLALLTLLLVPLGFLQAAIDQRASTQSRLHHEVVAARVFDELERELSLVLEREAERSGLNDPAKPWAPFVLGYFKEHLVTVPELSGEERMRIEATLVELGGTPVVEPTVATPPRPQQTKPLVPMRNIQATPRSSPEVLQQLNRATEQRKKSGAAQRPSSPSPDYGY